MSKNPLLVGVNKLIDFSELNPKLISEAASTIIKRSRKSRDKIVSISENERDYENTLDALDKLSHTFSKVLYPIYLMSSVHEDDAIRKVAEEEIVKLSRFSTDLQLDENLYKAIKSYSISNDAKLLEGAKKKYLSETIREYERNGFALPKKKRNKLKIVLNKLSEVSIQFHGNIANANDCITIEEPEGRGLPKLYLEERKQRDGSYLITLDTPSYGPFMKYAESDLRRKELYELYLNRAADKNCNLLNEMINLRRKLSNILGFTTFAEYNVENCMAKTPKVIWDFEKKLAKRVAKKADKDYEELLNFKQKVANSSESIQGWEKAYYSNLLLNQTYHLDQEEIKSYFELNATIKGMFSIFETLFNIKFEEDTRASVWHPDVRLFEVSENNRCIGRFYMDLFPRDKKYSHAACFGITSGRKDSNIYETPTVALVCNFSKPSKKQASLLYHRDVETLFHEFGHVLHSVLTKSEIHAYSGTSVSRDFVETPSQLLENWCWNYESLSCFAKHFETNETLPRELFNKMISAKNVASGIDIQQQLFYGILDMTLYDGFSPDEKEISLLVKELQNKLTKFPYLEGTHFEASFGHLDGYAAGYYGYLWSKVYAQDIFSIFEKKGILNAEYGKRLKKCIYEKGGTEDEFDMLKSFLKREPDDSAFISSLGV